MEPLSTALLAAALFEAGKNWLKKAWLILRLKRV
jgi:hypothetical protein